jgi:hypothetical protein
VAELAALEMLCTGNRTVGSNPTLSASQLRNAECGLKNRKQKAQGRKAAKTSAPLLPPAFGLSQSAFRNPKSAIERVLMRKIFLGAVLVGVVVLCALVFPSSSEAQNRRGRRGQVCGDPMMHCGTANEFQPHDLQFRLPRNAVIYETEAFYAIILKSVNAKRNCETHVSEEERLEAQKLFPRNKVFANRCPDAGTLYYTNTAEGFRFMAVYAGRTRTEANRMLETVRATGKYPTANIRRMTTGFNGT